jgi:hypothetical protein
MRHRMLGTIALMLLLNQVTVASWRPCDLHGGERTLSAIPGIAHGHSGSSGDDAQGTRNLDNGTGGEENTPPDDCRIGIGCVVAVPRAVAELPGPGPRVDAPRPELPGLLTTQAPPPVTPPPRV